MLLAISTSRLTSCSSKKSMTDEHRNSVPTTSPRRRSGKLAKACRPRPSRALRQGRVRTSSETSLHTTGCPLRKAVPVEPRAFRDSRVDRDPHGVDVVAEHPGSRDRLHPLRLRIGHQDGGELEVAVLRRDAANLIEQALRIGEPGDRAVGLGQRRVQVGQADDLLLGDLALAHIAGDRLHRQPPFVQEVARRHLHVADGAVHAHVLHLHRAQRELVLHDALHPLAREIAVVRMHEVVDGSAQQIGRLCRAEQSRRRGVGEHDAPLAVDQDGVGGELHQLAVALLGLLAHYELRDLPAHGARSPGEGQVGRPHALREELDHAERAVAGGDGEGEGAGEPAPERRRTALQAGFGGDVDDPARLAARQDAPHQTLARRASVLCLGGGDKLAVAQLRAAP